MKSLWIYLLLIAALSVAVNLTSFAQSPEQLYQKGLMKEEGEGALLDAINLYNQIADNTAADQSLRAKALLHIGLCYERMGKQGAVNAYQRLVNSFPTQKNEVAIAKERLNRLIMADKIVQQDVKKDLLITKVLTDTEIEPLGSPSPNGRYVSFTDWNSGGNLGILDLETKERKLLTDFKDPNVQTYYSSWSPDGKQIAYFWWRYDKDQYNLSVVNVQSAESRDLFISDKNSWIELGNWSSDGKYIFATLSLREEPKSQIVRISAADGTIKILKVCEESYLGGKPYVSPDNRFVVYNMPDKDASGNGDIFLLSLENGQENALIKHPSHDYILGWSSDGKNILFATDRSGTVDAMLISVEEGNPVGQPKPVKQNIGPIVPMGFTKDGSFFYGQWPGADNVYSAEISIDEGKLILKPNLLVERFVGRNYSPAYSSDGKHLAYISRRGVMNKGNPGPILCIRNLETGEELEVNPDLQNASHVSNLIWSPDDHSLALGSVNQDRYSRIYKYDIETRHFSPLVLESEGQPSDINYAFPIWSKNGKSIIYLQWNRYSETSRIMVRNISTGVERELYRYSSDDFMDRLFNISLSPDGKWLAAINRGEKRVVRLISTEDGEIRDLYRFISTGGSPYSPIWSKDGKYIVFPYYKKQSSYESSEWNLMRIPVEGGESLLIKMDIRGVGSPSLHPDGQTLAFRSAGTSFPENNIWEMKNFLPMEKEKGTMIVEESEGIKIRQIWKEPYLDFLGSVSSDGQFLSYIDWGNGDVAVHNIMTGEDKILTHEADLGDSSHFAQCPKISKNGKQIAYYWWNPYHIFDLCLIDVENPSPRILYRQEGMEVYPMTWLSDTELITIRQNRNTDTTKITSFNVLDGTFDDLKIFEGRKWAQLATSPDEKFIAYDFEDETNHENFDINVLPMDGSSEISLVNHPANDRVLGWVPGRKEFLFTSDRSGTWDLWAFPVDNGKPSGPVKRIYTNIGEVGPMGFSENGDCFVGFSRRNFNTYIVPFNKETGTLKEKSGKTILGSNLRLDWSPDGQYLTYNKEAEDSWQLTIQELRTGVERPLADSLLFSAQPRWSPDGKSILVFGFEKNKFRTKGYKGGFYTVDANTGQINEILLLANYKYNAQEDDRLPISGHEWSSDGKSIYILFHQDRLMKYDLQTGEEETLYKHPDLANYILKLSPDGQRLLIGLHHPGEAKSQLLTIPAAGGKEIELCTSQEADDFSQAIWSPDGKYIYFAERPEETNLWRITAGGGKPEKVWSSEKRAEMFSFHPDGDQIAFSVRERTTEIRAIENLSRELAGAYDKNE